MRESAFDLSLGKPFARAQRRTIRHEHTYIISVDKLRNKFFKFSLQSYRIYTKKEVWSSIIASDCVTWIVARNAMFGFYPHGKSNPIGRCGNLRSVFCFFVWCLCETHLGHFAPSRRTARTIYTNTWIQRLRQCEDHTGVYGVAIAKQTVTWATRKVYKQFLESWAVCLYLLLHIYYAYHLICDQ